MEGPVVVEKLGSNCVMCSNRLGTRSEGGARLRASQQFTTPKHVDVDRAWLYISACFLRQVVVKLLVGEKKKILKKKAVNSKSSNVSVQVRPEEKVHSRFLLYLFTNCLVGFDGSVLLIIGRGDVKG